MKHRTPLLFLAVTALSAAPAVHSLTGYANVFIDPTDILNKTYPNIGPANKTILNWAEQSAQQGPWTVSKKPFPPPSGDYHDYMSWAPYWWPDCSINVHNTTALSPQQIWQQCNYVQMDGQLNPDNRLINNIGDLGSMADAILYNSLSYVLTGTTEYAARVVTYINTWFLNGDTKMNPNLNYAQMQGGPNGQVGTHTGILDLKCMSKIVTGVLLLRQAKPGPWTSDVDTGLKSWAKEYIQWLTTADIALQERKAVNNHGTFYFNQLAALQILVGDTDGARQSIEEYFNGIYMAQVDANGDQSFESARTRPYHYRAYNLAAMITNAKLGRYVGVNVWNKTTSSGATIKTALDYAMSVPPSPAERDYAAELYPNVAAVAAIYGDPNNTYAGFLAKAEGAGYVKDACFLWSQPLSDSGLANAPPSVVTFSASGVTYSASKPAVWTGGPTAPAATGKKENAAFSFTLASWRAYGVLYGACIVVMIASFVEFL